MPFNPILGHTLRLSDLGFSHVPRNPFHVAINWRVQRGTDDSEPHVRLHVIPRQSPVAIHVSQLNLGFPHPRLPLWEHDLPPSYTNWPLRSRSGELLLHPRTSGPSETVHLAVLVRRPSLAT